MCHHKGATTQSILIGRNSLAKIEMSLKTVSLMQDGSLAEKGLRSIWSDSRAIRVDRVAWSRCQNFIK